MKKQARARFPDREIRAEDIILGPVGGTGISVSELEMADGGLFVVYAQDDTHTFFPLTAVTNIRFHHAETRRISAQEKKT